MATLMLIFCGRRVADLLLFHIGERDYIHSPRKVIFQPHIGSKTDLKGSSTWIQSKIKFKSHNDWSLDVCRMLPHYIGLTAAWRNNTTVLFLSARGHHRPASVGELRGWVRKTLERAGVTATPGSTRAATATAACLEGIPIAKVLENGNWKSESVFRAHYYRPWHRHNLR